MQRATANRLSLLDRHQTLIRPRQIFFHIHHYEYTIELETQKKSQKRFSFSCLMTDYVEPRISNKNIYKVLLNQGEARFDCFFRHLTRFSFPHLSYFILNKIISQSKNFQKIFNFKIVKLREFADKFLFVLFVKVVSS